VAELQLEHVVVRQAAGVVALAADDVVHRPQHVEDRVDAHA
jgi:hypothetical protein